MSSWADSPLRVWGLPSEVRLQRQLERAGAVEDDPQAQRLVLLRADWVYDDALVRGLVGADDDVALMAPDGGVVALGCRPRCGDRRRRAARRTARACHGPALVTPAQIADGYNDALRKREPPYLMPLTAADLPAIERRIFAGSYKGVTDLVTLYVWPRPARAVTRCARTPASRRTRSPRRACCWCSRRWRCSGPATTAGAWLAAWVMTFLDTVDGKLARVTLTSSRWGNVFDHSIDLIHPPFWWWAWIVGLPAPDFSLPAGQPGAAR